MMTTEETEALRLRFESHLPKYGSLWRSMAAKRQPTDFLSAIKSNTAVSLTIQHGDDKCAFGDCKGGCSAPIYEQEEEEPFTTKKLRSSDGSVTVDSESPNHANDGGKSLHIDLSNLHINEKRDNGAYEEELERHNEAPMSSEGSETVLQIRPQELQSSPASAASSSESQSSSGSTVIRFDLSEYQEGVQEEINTRQSLSNFLHLDMSNLQIDEEEKEERDTDSHRKSAVPLVDTPISPQGSKRVAQVSSLDQQSSPKSASGSSCFESSSGSTVIRFDLTEYQEEVQEEVDSREDHPLQAEKSKAVDKHEEDDLLFPDMARLQINEDPPGKRDSSLVILHVSGTKTDEPDEECVESENSNDDDNEQSDCSSDSSGNTVIRFDLSYLQAELQDTDDDNDREDDGFEIMPPSSPSLQKAVDSAQVHSTSSGQQSLAQTDIIGTPAVPVKLPSSSDEEELVDTPSSTVATKVRFLADEFDNVQSEGQDIDPRGYETGDSWLVDDDKSDEQSWALPTNAFNTVEIIDEDSSEGETEWNDVIDGDDEESAENKRPRNNTVIILSDDDDDSSDNSSQHRPQTPPLRKQKRMPKQQPSTASFRKNRDRLTAQAFGEFDELIFRGELSGVNVTWSKNMTTTAGLTRLKRSGAYKRASIELSTKVLDDEERLRHTLLHEMCHAAQWLVDGVMKPPHGACFKKWANRAMKCMPDTIVTTTHSYEIQQKYAWACTTEKCSFVVQRQSKSVDVTKHCCGKCKGKLVEINAPRKGASMADIDRTPKKKKPLSVYALFVKENSTQVRSKMESDLRMEGCTDRISQPEVMKECGRLWREKKNGAE